MTDSIVTVNLKPFSISVLDYNELPTLKTPIVDQSINEDSLYSYTVSINTFEDLDRLDSLTYSFDGPNWINFNPLTRVMTGTPSNNNVGSYSIKITATDKRGATVVDTFNLTVLNINDSPEDITLSYYSIIQNTKDDYYFSDIFVKDVDSNIFTSRLVAGDGSTHNHLFEIKSGKLYLRNSITSSKITEFYVRIQSSDGQYSLKNHLRLNFLQILIKIL